MIIEHLIVGSTAWLAYVTQLPYPRRRELHRQARHHTVRFFLLCVHHGKWVLWQITATLPDKYRRREAPRTDE